MEWQRYQECCHRNALDLTATFCDECGATLLRCVAYAECYSLVEPLTPCKVCVSTELYVDRGAVTNASVGDRLSIPLVLKNTSKIERPIWVAKALVRSGDEEFRPLDLPWERLGSGEERAFFVETGALEAGGTGVIEIEMAFGTRYKGYEEQYLYGGAVRFSSDTPKDNQITQNINLSGAQFGTGGLVNTSMPVTGGISDATSQKGSDDRIPVPFERYERHEIEFGVRGYAETGNRIPRTVRFRFNGFPSSQAPADIAIGSRGVLVFGRNSRTFHEERNRDPSDVVLRIVDPRTGETDREASYGISRRHFDLLILNNRLCIHVRSSNGVLVNGERVSTSSLATLKDDDVIAPIAGRPDAIALRIAIVGRPDGLVETIAIDRQPHISAPTAASAQRQGAR